LRKSTSSLYIYSCYCCRGNDNIILAILWNAKYRQFKPWYQDRLTICCRGNDNIWPFYEIQNINSLNLDIKIVSLYILLLLLLRQWKYLAIWWNAKYRQLKPWCRNRLSIYTSVIVAAAMIIFAIKSHPFKSVTPKIFQAPFSDIYPPKKTLFRGNTSPIIV
jgi:hypothetical protein